MLFPYRPQWHLLLLGILWASSLAGMARAQELEPEVFRPSWKVGQKWVVETVGLQNQMRKAPQRAAPNRPVRWQFKVENVEEVEGKTCFRIVLRCLEPGENPETTLWVDQDSLTLLKIRMQLPSREGFRTVTETYRSESGQPFPTISVLTVPPIDLPLFIAGAKANSSFQYRASTAPEGAKDAANIDFAISIEQQLTEPSDDDLRRLLPEQFAKSAENAPVVEVRLTTGRSDVRQLWKKGSPWPVYSNNGVATSRLIRADDAANGAGG